MQMLAVSLLQRLRVSQPALVVSLSLGMFASFCCANLVAHAQPIAYTPIPSLSGYDFETRQSIEMACIVKKSDGPVAYGACLDEQITSLTKASVGFSTNGGVVGAPQAELPAASSTKNKKRRVVSGTPASLPPVLASRFTAEKVLAIHQGMSSKKVLEMFGAPKNVSQGVCGASVGEPWPCTHWEYGEVVHEWASFTFAERNGSLILNNFDVRRK